MSSNTIPKRKDVSEEETWKLDDLFKDFNEWEKSFQELPDAQTLNKLLEERFKNKLGESPSKLYECLTYRDELSRKLDNLYVYANLRAAEDVSNKEANEFTGRIDFKSSEIYSQLAFIEPEILTIPNISSWITTEPLNGISI
jgi:oligoendopeptidase F